MVANRIYSAKQDERLAEVIAAYLQAAERQNPPSRRKWLAMYPELAAELEEFFAGEDQMNALVKPLQPLLCASSARREGGRPPETFDATTSPIPCDGRPCSIGDYELLGEIARGGMGVVYRARQISLNRIVALKMILAGRFASGDEVDRFRREAVAVANLDHPHIVPIYEVCEEEGRHYFSMKLIEGGNLADRALLYAKEPRATAKLVATVARAVHHAHQRGLLHRDLKPANILLDDEGQPHVSDFGLAKCVAKHELESMSGSGALVGTPSYMAPEQAAGARQLTTAADIYSLGVILYELLAGHKPFRAQSPLEMLMQATQSDPPPLRRVNPRIDADLQTICLKCLEKDPGRRYGSALALAEDLEQWLEGKPIRARSSGPFQRGVKWTKRRPASAALLGVSVSAAIVIAALLAAGHVRTAQSLASLREEQQKASAALMLERNARKRALEALLENARLTTDALRIFNEVYASEVVERMKANGIEATHHYADNPQAIPLPYSLSSELARRITSYSQNKEIRIYSDYPFPWNSAQGGPRDRFEEEALAQLRLEPDKPFYRFEEYQGKPALRYATAVRIEPSCVTAHNVKAARPTDVWQEGDVSGVYEVILPVDDAVAELALLED